MHLRLVKPAPAPADLLAAFEREQAALDALRARHAVEWAQQVDRCEAAAKAVHRATGARPVVRGGRL